MKKMKEKSLKVVKFDSVNITNRYSNGFYITPYNTYIYKKETPN